MFELEKSFFFAAGHQLVNHQGACARKHGHTYKLTLNLQTKLLQSSGPQTNMYMDFADIEVMMKDLLDNYLDHHWLNDTLQTNAPTMEFIAKWVFDQVKPRLPQLVSVAISIPQNRIVYSE